MTAQVVQMKSQSVNALTQQTKAAWERADKEQKNADAWAVRTGKLLVELKARVKAEGGSWLEMLEKMGRGERRARELMALAGGEVTVEDQREVSRRSSQKTRDRKTASRDADNCDKKATVKFPEVAVYDDDEDPAEQRCCWSLQNLFGDILSRTALLDKLYPGWKKFEFPSDLQTTGKDASTELASILKTIGVK